MYKIPGNSYYANFRMTQEHDYPRKIWSRLLKGNIVIRENAIVSFLFCGQTHMQHLDCL